MKEDNKNKLKQFVKKHELAFAIAGGAVILVGVFGLTYLGLSKANNITMSDLKKLAAKDKSVARLFELAELCDAATAGTSIETFTKTMTIAEYFGEYAEHFMAGSTYQPDDIVANVIFNIAKKA